MTVDTNAQVPMDLIEQKIYLVRGQKVMIDADLALLYGVQTKALKQAVKRNIKRFPADFMFSLSAKEHSSLRSQFVTSKTSGRGGSRYAPMFFTEQGVAMLSSVLNSERAVAVNVVIIRTFVRLRSMIASHADLAAKLKQLETKYDARF